MSLGKQINLPNTMEFSKQNYFHNHNFILVFQNYIGRQNKLYTGNPPFTRTMTCNSRLYFPNYCAFNKHYPAIFGLSLG